MPSIPHLDLSHGQVAWALSQGSAPHRSTIDALRYLRLLGVPFTQEEQGSGSGIRLSYGFDQLIECAAAMYAIRHGAKPRHVGPRIAAERTALRKLFRQAFRECPAAALEAPWIQSRGKIQPTVADERFLRLHDSSGTALGRIETMTLDEVLSLRASFGDMVERIGTEVHVLVPIKRVMLEAVAWALIAPATPAGRRPKQPLTVDSNPQR